MSPTDRTQQRREVIESFERASYAWKDVQQTRADLEETIVYLQVLIKQIADDRRRQGYDVHVLLKAQEAFEKGAKTFAAANERHNELARQFMEKNLVLYMAVTERDLGKLAAEEEPLFFSNIRRAWATIRGARG